MRAREPTVCMIWRMQTRAYVVVCACATSVKAQLKMSTAPMNRRRFMLGGYVDSRGRHFDFGGRT